MYSHKLSYPANEEIFYPTQSSLSLLIIYIRMYVYFNFFFSFTFAYFYFLQMEWNKSMTKSKLFSESLEEMGDCLLEKTALSDDEESGKQKFLHTYIPQKVSSVKGKWCGCNMYRAFQTQPYWSVPGCKIFIIFPITLFSLMSVNNDEGPCRIFMNAYRCCLCIKQFHFETFILCKTLVNSFVSSELVHQIG